MLVQLPWNNEA